MRYLSIILLFVLAACQDKATPALKTAPLTVSGATISAEIADTPETMQRGLMFRDTLAADSGMLFVFGRPHQASFWMRNTKIPLTIAYLDADGRILELHDMFPYDESPVASLNANVVYALEMNQGWFKHRGITPGMTVSGSPIARLRTAK